MILHSCNISVIASLTMLFLVTAAANADVLYLKNGDRITGEIKRIWDDEVTIEPEYSDEFAVDLPLVERIESDREFEIEMPDGIEVVGRMQGIDADGKRGYRPGYLERSAPVSQPRLRLGS